MNIFMFCIDENGGELVVRMYSLLISFALFRNCLPCYKVNPLALLIVQCASGRFSKIVRFSFRLG